MNRTNKTPRIPDDRDTEELLRELLESSESDLEPIKPEKAMELYLEDKARECQQSTVRSHRSRLGFFVDWCDEQDIENLNDLSARDVHEFRVWRREDLNVTSEKTQMDTLRVFVEWCETIDAVQHGLFKKIKSPVIPDGGNVRETTLTTDRANEILDYMEKYEYATVEHVTLLILVETGMRMGGAHALDVDDYRRETEHPHLKLHHRTDTDTPLKNGSKGGRPVSITSEACDLIDDYLENRRPDVTDEHGRDPLLASHQGRISKSTIRKYVYKWSRPCTVGASCPWEATSKSRGVQPRARGNSPVMLGASRVCNDGPDQQHPSPGSSPELLGASRALNTRFEETRHKHVGVLLVSPGKLPRCSSTVRLPHTGPTLAPELEPAND